jgi:hypothetical protein
VEPPGKDLGGKWIGHGKVESTTMVRKSLRFLWCGNVFTGKWKRVNGEGESEREKKKKSKEEEKGEEDYTSKHFKTF